MGTELTILKELGTISMTSAELAAVTKIIREEIDAKEFRTELHSLLSDMVNTYQLVVDIFTPFTEISTQRQFKTQFSDTFQRYSDEFNQNLSIPRVNAEFTFEKTLQFRKLTPVKTSYPILKRAFARLLEYIDKWHDNDIWLSMSIDMLMKMVLRLMNEVNDIQKKDTEQAFLLYESSASHYRGFLAIIENNIQSMDLNSL